MIRTILKCWEFWLILIIGVSLFFAFITSANAATLEQPNFSDYKVITTSNDETAQLLNWQPSVSSEGYLTVDFDREKLIDLSGDISTISVKVRPIQTDSRFTFRLARWSSFTAGGSTIETILAYEDCSSLETISINTTATITRNFSSHSLNPDKPYWIQIKAHNSACSQSGRLFDIFGQNNNPFIGGSAWNYSSQQFSDNFDAYFITNGSYGPPPPQNAIAITLPQDNSTTTDFVAWKAEYSFADGIEIGSPGVPEVGSIVINYGNSTSSMPFTDTWNVFMWSDASSTTHIGKTTALNPLLTWFARAKLYDASSTLVATSSIINFGVEIESYYPETPTSTLPTATSTCASAGDFFTQGLCYMFNFLFTPSQASINNFSNLKIQIEKKPPFGYASAIYGAFTGFSSSTATSSLDALNLASFGNLPTTAPIKTTLTIIIWLMFGYWLFQRLRHFEF